MLMSLRSILVIMFFGSISLTGCKKEKPIADTTPPIASSESSVDSPLLTMSKVTGTTGSAASSIPPAPAPEAKAYVLMDANSGAVLAEHNSSDRVEPASLTKLMTAYIVFDALKIGKVKLSDLATISEHAWKTGGAGTDGSTSFLPIGSQISIDFLIQGMLVQSGNDAAIALAEHIAGDESTFAKLMNVYAEKLHMSSTHFANASGLPSPEEFTTAHDLSLLAQHLAVDFPERYHYFAIKEFTFNKTTQHNRNGLLERDSSVDGIKTGHTDAAGYCLIASAKRDTMRLISVVMKTPSFKAREDGSLALLNYGFSFYETAHVFAKDHVLQTAIVRKGVENNVAVTPASDIVLTIPRGRAADIKADVAIAKYLIAPLSHDTSIGKLTLSLDGKVLNTYDVYPARDIPQAGIIGRTIDNIKMFFSH